MARRSSASDSIAPVTGQQPRVRNRTRRWVIRSCGPTLRRLLGRDDPGAGDPVGRAFSDLFTLRHGPDEVAVADLLAGQGRLYIDGRGQGDLAFRGIV